MTFVDNRTEKAFSDKPCAAARVIIHSYCITLNGLIALYGESARLLMG